MKLFSRGVALVSALALVASCGGTDSAQRTLNTALPEKYVLGYSCAQLVTEAVTESTSEIRFTLCDEAGSYSIVTPEGVSGAVNDQVVEGGEEIAVPISSAVNGPESTLMVKIAGSPWDENATYHSGVHIYRVSLELAEWDFVGAASGLGGSLYPKVVFDFPTPQLWTIYRRGFRENVSRDQYAAYLDELAQKWAMVRLTTCHPNVAHARMADAEISNVVFAFAEAQLNAKQARDLDFYFALNALRNFTVPTISQANICLNGIQGFNLFTNGIEVGFQPMPIDEIASSSDVLALAKSRMLLDYWRQIKANNCVAPSGVTVSYEESEMEPWANQVLERLRIVNADENTPGVDRTASQRLLTQIDLLSLIGNVRRTFDGVPSCAASSAGYAVPVKQAVEDVSSTLPSADNSASNSGSQPLANIVNNSTPSATIPPSQLAWSAANKVVQKIRVGQTLSKAQLAAQSGLALTAKSSVKLTSVASSKKICSVKTWGLKAVKAGSCKVRVSVINTGKKTQSKTLTLQVTK